MTALDLSAYLHRIAWQGPLPAPDAATLQRLAALHAAAIPFENLSPWLGEPVALTPAALQAKLVGARRGGYCFEQNGLFRRVLEALGFAVTGLAARVLWGQPAEAVTPRTHRALLVTLAGEHWLVDVGFGGLTLSGALRLQAEVAQSTAHEPFRLLHRPDDELGPWHQQAWVGDAWRTTYRFSLEPQHPVDDELANHYTATHPTSRFVQHLVVARALPDRRLALLDTELRVHWLEGRSEHHRLPDVPALRQVLTQDFGLQLPDHPRLADRLASLFAPSGVVDGC